ARRIAAASVETIGSRGPAPGFIVRTTYCHGGPPERWQKSTVTFCRLPRLKGATTSPTHTGMSACPRIFMRFSYRSLAFVSALALSGCSIGAVEDTGTGSEALGSVT